MTAYLFDFDGTLVDSMPAWETTMLRILNENHINYPPDIIKTITPLGFARTAVYFRTLGMKLPEKEIIALMHTYASEAYLSAIPAKPHVPETLRALRARGHSLSVLTASPHSMLDPCLKRLGLYELFDHIWSCDDFETTKTDPAIYCRAAEQIGAPVQSVIFLDDNYHADLTAVRAGMRVFGVYDRSSADYTEEIKAITERYIYDFSELL